MLIDDGLAGDSERAVDAAFETQQPQSGAEEKQNADGKR